MNFLWPRLLFLGLIGSGELLSSGVAARETKQVPNTQTQSVSAEQSAKPHSIFQEPVQEIDQRRRAELLIFIRENHPELEPLVLSLKDKLPRQYENAVRSIDKSVSQLQAIKDGGNQLRYEQALEYWKLSSRIQLLSAQLTLDDTPANRKKLKRLITKQIDERKAQWIADRDRMMERLERLNESIAKAETGREAEIDQRLESIIRNAERTRAQREEPAGDSADPARKIGPAPASDKQPTLKKNEGQTHPDKRDKE